MSVIVRYGQTIWPAIEAAVPMMQSTRNGRNGAQRAGLNFNIILSAACYVEGILEAALRALLSYRRSIYSHVNMPEFELRRSMNVFYSRMEERLDNDISRATGAKAYDELFEILHGSSLRTLSEVAPLWEGLIVLFTFRNVLAHGREIVARRRGRTLREEQMLTDDFTGGYAAVEKYLLKARLSDRRFFEGYSKNVFLTDMIADHFWNMAMSLPRALVASLPADVREEVEPALLGKTEW